QFGGRYHTPHGLANAIVLPQVLRFLAPAVIPRLAALALRARLGTDKDNEQVLAKRFLDAVDELNRDLGIPTHLAALREKDIPALAEAALHEAHTGYPVPRYMTRAECEALIRRLLPPKEEAAAPAEEHAAPAAGSPAATPPQKGKPKASRAPRKTSPRKTSPRKTSTAE
ncbi:MAG TPA: iron-containing alcohol dehydrogenase, partial [Burkholderiaceae bacterium]|nr:iron-containing alcohol dehydrogenase [Burkholderiaceae bacterium]